MARRTTAVTFGASDTSLSIDCTRLDPSPSETRELMLVAHRSNFEIADMDFFRSEPYSRYFDHLDRSGGFSYERWGGELISDSCASVLMSTGGRYSLADGNRSPQMLRSIRLLPRCSCNRRRSTGSTSEFSPFRCCCFPIPDTS